uniref:Uncharacterized protein n=1 Tax=Salix viminalis TaxID=40686 RepID=A0A6N2KUT8_SALVM
MLQRLILAYKRKITGTCQCFCDSTGRIPSDSIHSTKGRIANHYIYRCHCLHKCQDSQISPAGKQFTS